MGILSVFRGPELKARTARSFLLTGFSFGSENLVRLIGNLILTRILFPEAFGLMALVQTVFVGVSMLSDVGIRSAVVKDERGADPVFLNTAWTLQILRGVLIWLLICAAAGPIARFYDEPLLAQALPVSGFVAVLQGFNSIKLATAERELMLGRVTLLALVTQFLGLLATIALALWLQSVWALIMGNLIGAALMTCLSHLMLKGRRDRLALEPKATRSILNFGAYIFIASIAGFLILQSDRAILGKLIPLGELALFTIAFFFAALPRQLGQTLVSRIIFPLYARRPPWKNEADRAKIARARWGLTGVLVSGLAILSLIGPFLINLLYDDRYLGAGPLLVLISVAMLPGIVTTSYANLPLASGNSRRFAFLLICLAVIQTGIMLAGGVRYGVVGVALAPIVTQFIYYPILVSFIRPYRSWDPVHDLSFFLMSAVIAAVAFTVNADVIAPLFAAL